MARLRGRALACAVALACLAACRHPDAPVVTILNDQDVSGLDPHRVGGVFQTQTVLANMYEPLVAIDSDMALEPALAVSWSNPDDHTWEFAIRPDVAFHTGGTLSAEDVAWSFERARQAGGPLAGAALGNVEAVEAVAPLLLRVRTRAPDATLARRLRDVPVISKTFVASAGDGALQTRSAGTGAYRLAGHAAGAHVDLERFDGYWGGPAAAPRARFVGRAFGAADASALVPRNAAVVFWEPAPGAARDAAARDHRRFAGMSLAVSYLAFDLRGPTTPAVRLPDGSHRNPFLDPRVRAAIALAVDPAEIAARAHDQASEAATQLVAPVVLGYDRALTARRPEPVRARAMLAEAGFADGFDVDLDARAMMAATATPLVEQLGRAGIRAHLAVRPEEEFFERVHSGQSSMFVLRFSCRSGDAQELLDKWVHSRDDARGYGQSNYSYERNPVAGMDEDIERVRGILRPATRLPLLQSLMRRLVDANVAIPLLHEGSVAYASARLRWKPRADTFFIVREMELAEP